MLKVSFWKNSLFIILSNKCSNLNIIFYKVRRVWKDYFPAVDAIVFLIDVWDRVRFEESIIELDSLISDEQLASCPILILGNKIDKYGAAGEQEIRSIFKLYNKTTGQVWMMANLVSKKYYNFLFNFFFLL